MSAHRNILLTLFFAMAAYAETGSLRIYFLQLPVGQEAYELKDNTLTASFEYTERGSNVAMKATLKMKDDLTPEHFEAHGRAYRPFAVDESITPQAMDRPFFTVATYSPLSVQMMLLRYWLAREKPIRLRLLPGDRSAEIEQHATESVNGHILTRYSISEVVWGRESVWLDEKQQIVAAVTYAGNLPIEAVRDDYRDAFPQFIRESVSDRMHELHSVTQRIKPLQNGAYAITGATVIDGTGAAPRQATVTVVNGRIVAVGARPTDLRTIDGTGKTLLPGLWEMH
ncbi:MAG: hypothetical protein LAO79_17540, partial [Acidobacteriia bacterium]|nr:hypothetical protein [Terriglobia bacterium]